MSQTHSITSLVLNLQTICEQLDFRDRRVFVLFSMLYLLLLFPLLFLGYGGDPDAWRLALSAWHILADHAYTVSRFPGYPVVEFGLAIFVWGDYPLVNFGTAIVSLGGLFAFNHIAHEKKIEHAGLYTLLLAASPLWLLWSASGMDYIWSVSFFLLSLWTVINRRYFSAGLLFSLAVGSRPTNILLGVVFVSYLLLARVELKNTFQFFLGFIMTSAVWISPLYLKYGTSFLTFYPSVELSWGVWYAIRLVSKSFGTLFIVVALLVLVHQVGCRLNKFRINPALFHDFISSLKKYPLAISMIVACFPLSLAFLYQPLEAGYILPLIPLLLFVIGRVFQLSRRVKWLLLGSLIVSSFLPIPWNYSPVPQMVSSRIYLENRAVVLLEIPFGNDDVLMAAWFSVRLQLYRERGLAINWAPGFEFVYVPTNEQLARWLAENKTIWYLSEIESFLLQQGVNPETIGAIPISP